ncbi:MAG: hypothetical protein V4622_07960 [Bacteroidota bacterium]
MILNNTFKNLKKTSLVFLFFIGSSVVFSQEIDNRLLKKYSKTELINIKKNDVQEYNFLVKAVKEGVYVSNIPTSKGKRITYDGTLNIDPNQDHTFISLEKEITDEYQFYRIEGTQKMLVIQPRILLDKRVSISKK